MAEKTARKVVNAHSRKRPFARLADEKPPIHRESLVAGTEDMLPLGIMKVVDCSLVSSWVS